MKRLSKIPFERITLFVVGLTFLVSSLLKYLDDKSYELTGIGATIGLMCLIFANLARFKKFKGFGFEGELWEDKQQEAADLINLFKAYTDQIVMGSVMNGRFDSGDGWPKRWKLFDDLTGYKFAKGETLDFSELRKNVEDVFLFDICMNLTEAIRGPLNAGRQEAAQIIANEYSRTNNVEAYTQQTKANDIPLEVVEPFRASERGNLARQMLELADSSSSVLKDNFGVFVKFDPTSMARLKAVAELADKRPIKITAELLHWAERK